MSRVRLTPRGEKAVAWLFPIVLVAVMLLGSGLSGVR